MMTALPWQRPRAALATTLWPADATPVIACRPSYLSPLAWLVLQAAALWPHGLWIARRALDGSDDPLGLAALAVLALLLWRMAPRLRVAPRLGWLAIATGLTLAANAALLALPPLACGMVAVGALAASLMAWLPAGVARTPLAGLVVLALPLVASLQYYGGYPLRVVTAQLSAWALQLVGIAAERSGAAMTVRGQLVIVDSPCSGVQMVWLAYFCACTFAALAGLRDADFLRRLPLIGVTVLVGNVLRNSVLVALESRPQGLAGEVHAAIGLLALGGVCAAEIWLMNGGRVEASTSARPMSSPLRRGSSVSPRVDPRLRGDDGLARLWSAHWPAAMVALLLACALLPLVQPAPDAAAPRAPHAEWPTQFDGRELRPLAASVVEQRFAARFPGAIGRFTDGEQVFVLRAVARPTRQLHPAADCFRGLGYRIEQARLETDGQRRLWRCFEAVAAGGQRLRVCERIEARDGASFVDASAWFWAASLGRSAGPWLAVTRVEAL